MKLQMSKRVILYGDGDGITTVQEATATHVFNIIVVTKSISEDNPNQTGIVIEGTEVIFGFLIWHMHAPS